MKPIYQKAIHEDDWQQTMRELSTDAIEALVEIARPMRDAVGPVEAAFVTQFNDKFEA